MAAFNLSFRIITIQSSQTPRSINHLVNTLIYQTPPIPQREPTQQTKQDICGNMFTNWQKHYTMHHRYNFHDKDDDIEPQGEVAMSAFGRR